MRRVVALVLAVAALSACSSEVPVEPYEVDPESIDACAVFYDDLPRTVAGQDAVDVLDDRAAAWGDPAIVVRCGGPAPDALTISSPCAYVDDVGWFAERDGDDYRFTTIGRTFFVRVDIPAQYAPPSDVLIDLAPSITKHDPVVKDCV